MLTVTIAESPHGGWRLRINSPEASDRWIGHYATAEDASRMARRNGFTPLIESYDADAQLEFSFWSTPLARSA